jgi:hypothetical protein
MAVIDRYDNVGRARVVVAKLRFGPGRGLFPFALGPAVILFLVDLILSDRCILARGKTQYAANSR